MELTYQREMQLPCQYSLLTEEEMTYFDGGAYTFSVFGYNVTINPEVLGDYMTNFAVNFMYIIGAGALSAAITGVVKGYQDGLSIGQTVSHFWGRQNTAGRIASIFVGGLAGFYAYAEAVQLYNTFKEVIDAFKGTGTETAAAAA